MEDFNTIITDTINAASKGLTRKMDSLLLGDIKRMTDNGTLTIEIQQPEFKPFDGTAMSVEQGGRVRFTGEETIEAQAERIKDLEVTLHNTKPFVGAEFTGVIDCIEATLKSTRSNNSSTPTGMDDAEICYKSGEKCKYDCSGLCKESV